MFPAEHDEFEKECIAKLEHARRARLSRWSIFCEDFPRYAKAVAIPGIVIIATVIFSFIRTEPIGQHPRSIQIGQAGVVSP
jgi:hypothetical protein